MIVMMPMQNDDDDANVDNRNDNTRGSTAARKPCIVVETVEENDDE
jgi:hypothetical protein